MSTLIDIDNRATAELAADRPPAEVRRFSPRRARRSSARPAADACYSAPARFDVHQVVGFEHWVTESIEQGACTLAIDASNIDFVDLAAIEAIERVRQTHLVDVVDPSSATRITFHLLGVSIQTMAFAEAA
jgi:anti-anti-sigma regulatory factor